MGRSTLPLITMFSATCWQYSNTFKQFENKVGMPSLPADLDGRRQSFNTALVEFGKKLPATNAEIQARQ